MIQKLIDFSVDLAGNSSNTSVDVDFSKDPVVIHSGVNPLFNFKDSPVTGIVPNSLTNTGNIPVTAVVNKGIVTFTFKKAPVINVPFMISGTATVTPPG
jgi:hypothetical protein